MISCEIILLFSRQPMMNEFPTHALEDATNYSPTKSVLKLPLKSPWDFSHIGNVVYTTLEYDYKWELQFIRWHRL